MNGIVFTSEWAKTHPTDAQLLSDELLYEALEAEAAERVCGVCVNYCEDYIALKEGWGICLRQPEDMEVFFTEEDSSCPDWEHV